MSIRQGEKCVYRLDIFFHNFFLLAVHRKWNIFSFAGQILHSTQFMIMPKEERKREREKKMSPGIQENKIIASVSMILHLS